MLHRLPGRLDGTELSRLDGHADLYPSVYAASARPPQEMEAAKKSKDPKARVCPDLSNHEIFEKVLEKMFLSLVVRGF